MTTTSSHPRTIQSNKSTSAVHKIKKERHGKKYNYEGEDQLNHYESDRRRSSSTGNRNSMYEGWTYLCRIMEFLMAVTMRSVHGARNE